MNNISSGHNYVFPTETRQELNKGIKEARELLGEPAPRKWNYDYSNKKLTEIIEEDKFAKQAEEEYQKLVKLKRRQIKQATEELEYLENNKEKAITYDLISKLRDAIYRLKEKIQTDNIYYKEGPHPNRWE
ncbi:MAG: hypothetical protein NC191_03030 [Muribaculaceae bacterium]|nr:hypothetical protein [Muribaculaceae bacterium]